MVLHIWLDTYEVLKLVQLSINLVAVKETYQYIEGVTLSQVTEFKPGRVCLLKRPGPV